MADLYHQSNIPAQPDILITNSSSILGYSYDPKAYVLTVWYKGKSGSIYQFFNVFPNAISEIFDSPYSVGKKLKENIKGLMFQKLK
jgi:hypothetical protein